MAHFGFRRFKAKKNKPVVKDFERGNFVLSKTREDSEDESIKSQHMMTPALVSNSVQAPVTFSRNF